ncbi:CatB-related O-acetyltransferase [Candidatus Trichorickettsia mobilis]|uniref:CatB-related O-acetyltransferase n=2 Tax=Candidatus Trichorickettsia mobilis TaxID=1346319 RepID=A0ABZ0UVL0_9RICK|nr:CatB-related O-acetyltransferase [Candidatus Trichorickettsia mobilis]
MLYIVINMINDIYLNPNIIYPIEGVKRTCFLKNIITNPQIIVGDYTYYDDPEDIHNFETNVLYLFDFMQDQLIIGKFCQIATAVRFIMNGSNHAMDGISTYPFKVFGKSWTSAAMNVISKGDTVVGNDVWIGNSATIMQGIKIGHGAIIGTNALVTKDVEPYTVIGGNPAQVIRKRFDDKTIVFLLQLAWWDWPIEKITENIQAITMGDLEVLKKLASSKNEN